MDRGVEVAGAIGSADTRGASTRRPCGSMAPMTARRVPDPFFIIGTERSGSNLLRLMLNAHPDVVVPHPPHVLHLLGPLEAAAGPAGAPETLRRLSLLVAGLVDHHIHPWAHRPQAEALAAAAEPPDLMGLTLALYDEAAQAAHKPRWGCKSTFTIHAVDRVLAARPAARFLWLVRDPRDVAVSSLDSVFNPKDPLHVGQLWARQQRLGLELHARHPDAVHLLPYEALIADPEGRLRQVLAFLGLPWDPAVLRHRETPEAAHIASLSASWKNNDRDVLSNNAGKWRKRLGRRDAARIAAVAGPEMRALGYAVDPDDEGYTIGVGDRIAAGLGELRGRVRVELQSMHTDKNHWRRWRRRAWLWRQTAGTA